MDAVLKKLKNLRMVLRREANREFKFSREFTDPESKSKAWGMYCGFEAAANKVDKLIKEVTDIGLEMKPGWLNGAEERW